MKRIAWIAVGSTSIILASVLCWLVATTEVDWYIRIFMGIFALMLFVFGLGAIVKPKLAKEVLLLFPFIW